MRSLDLSHFAWLAALGAVLACGGRADSDERSPDDVQTSEPASPVAQPAEPEPVRCAPDGVWRASARVQAQADLEHLAGCERIAGDLSIELFAGLDPRPLASLRVVEGLVSVFADPSQRAPSVERPLDVLSSLEEAGGLQVSGVQAPNLDALSRLRTLSGGVPPSVVSPGPPGLLIEACPRLTSLTGLEQLESVGLIRLRENPDLVSLRGLDGLRAIDTLAVSDTPLADLAGFDASSLRVLELSNTAVLGLTGLGAVPGLEQLWLSSNRALTHLDGAVFGESLAVVSVDNNVSLASVRGLGNVRRLTTFSLSGSPSLVTLEGLEQLAEVDGLGLFGLGVQSLAGLGALVTAEQISLGSLLRLVDLAGMSSLTRVSHLAIAECRALTSLVGLGAFSAGALSLRSVGASSLAGLEAVSIESELEVSESPSFTSLTGLPELGESAWLRLANLSALADTSALAGRSVLGHLVLEGTGLGVLSGLGALQRAQRIELFNNYNLTEIEDSPQLSQVGQIRIDANPLLRTLPAWGAVTGPCAGCADVSLRIWNNAALESGPELPALQSASEVLIANNPSLRELSSWLSLRELHTLRVVNNVSLVSLELPALEQASGLDIHGNSSLDEALLLPLSERLESRLASQILSNSSGPALLDPCPWADDGICDEVAGACAPRADATDCP